MRRLVELWNRLSARERILATVAAGALVLVVARLGIVDPYFSYVTQLEDRVDRDVQRVAKMERLLHKGPQIAGRLTALRREFETLRGRLIPGETPSLAAAHLQERLQTLAADNGLSVVTTQVLRDEALGDFRKTAVQVTLRGDTLEVANLLNGIEYGQWLLAVTRLEVRSTNRRRSRRSRRATRSGVAAQQPPLTITLEVSGVMQGDEPAAPARES